MNISRRNFLGFLVAATAAPIIVRAGILMPIKPALVIATEMPDMVEVALPGDGVQWVGVNGDMLHIPRGPYTPIPREYFAALRNSNLEMRWRDEREAGYQEKDSVMIQATQQIILPTNFR